VSGVSEIAPQLPTDIEALQALIAAARAERDAAMVERDQALSQIDRLRHLLRQLQRAQFGRRSEKLDPEQLLLALEDIEQAVAGNEAADDKKIRPPPEGAATSVAPIVARFPPICRMSM
jgi:transposase